MKLPTFSGHSSWINSRERSRVQLGFWLSLEIQAFDAHSIAASLSCDRPGRPTGLLDWYVGIGQGVRIMVGSSGWGHWLGHQWRHAFRASQQAR